MTDARTITIISELAPCLSGAAVSSTPRQGFWQLIPYHAEEVSGTMVIADAACKAPPLTILLNVRGWYRVSLGVWADWENNTLRVKLSDDPTFTPFITPSPFAMEGAASPIPLPASLPSGLAALRKWHSGFSTLREIFWTCADLTGQEFCIEQAPGRRAGLAFIKLEPLTDAEVEELQHDRARTDTKRLIGYNDAWNLLETRTLEGLHEEVEHMRHTDFQKLMWCIGSGSETYFPSEVGEFALRRDWDFTENFLPSALEGWRVLTAAGIDPLKSVIEYAHSFGLELHAMYIVGGWVYPPNHGFENKFYYRHPEWRCADRTGRPISRMSYAYQDVRDFILALLREVVERGADGINFGFNRGLPCVLYEEPMVEGFRKQYGLDPRELDERDARWLAFKSNVMTDFMRSVRQTMDSLGQELGRTVQVSAYVLYDVPTNLAYGLDVAAWAREGLVDFIIPYPWREFNLDMDIDAFVELARGTRCKVYPEVMPRRQSPESYRTKALEFYRAGVDGLSFWDVNTTSRVGFKDEWSMVRRLGHKDELEEWKAEEGGAYRIIPLREVGGVVMDEYSPYDAS